MKQPQRPPAPAGSARSPLTGEQGWYLERMYQSFRADPDSVSATWQRHFAELPAPGRAGNGRAGAWDGAHAQSAESASGRDGQRRVDSLVRAYREFGHRQARINPLPLQSMRPIELLEPGWHQLGAEHMERRFQVDSGQPRQPAMRLRELIERLRGVYCGSVGVEYMHVTDIERREWIQQRIEERDGDYALPGDAAHYVLERLTAAEGLEHYLASRYPGTKRFGLEGSESLLVVLDAVVRGACMADIAETVIGMAHRGRLNVLVNLLGKTPAEVFDEFEDRAETANAGDVKYHQGFSSHVVMGGQYDLHLALSFNPSHLEIIGPVVSGSVRARQDRRSRQAPKDVALAVLVHGDAAFAGQGVVMEALQMSQTRGFCTGGSIHIIVNNQIGFTTSDARDARSSWHCTDIAKFIEAPIFHVNGDDPEAAVFVSGLAFDYRQRFGADVVIDLLGYRRRGHNEADEPSITQPGMYRAIRARKTARELHAESLARRGLVDADQAQAMVTRYRALLDQGHRVAHFINESPDTTGLVNWAPYLNQDPREADHPERTPTGVPAARLRALSEIATEIPDGFALQRQVAKVIDARRRMGAGEAPFDWGGAETLAYASLLADGHPVRLTGQDVRRGTFSHRHATLHDQHHDERSLTPLQRPDLDWARFAVYDSLLSELAVLGFEYGYAATQPDGLVIWEAQFGDFANNAQVVVDQFVSSGANKWGRVCGLTMLLPHGYEGQGAEHSSARLERYMQLCAEDNMRVCAPTTPAQMFHLLRRQALSLCRLPLVVMTPKSLLRHPMAVSALSELSDGHFHCVLDDGEVEPEAVRRLVVCSGKVYYELRQMREERDLSDVAIVRIEQIYPFPYDEFSAIVRRFPRFGELVWCQEEPRNQGAWHTGRHRLIRVLERERPGIEVSYAGRPPSASPAVARKSMHAEEQRQVAERALGVAETA